MLTNTRKFYQQGMNECLVAATPSVRETSNREGERPLYTWDEVKGSRTKEQKGKEESDAGGRKESLTGEATCFIISIPQTPDDRDTGYPFHKTRCCLTFRGSYFR